MAKQARERRREPEWLLWAVSGLGWATLATLALFLTWQAWRGLQLAGGLLGVSWRPEVNQFGLLPLLVGTMLVTALAAAAALPAGFAAALYMSEFAAPAAAAWWRSLLELAGGVPSVVYGFAGSVLLVPRLSAAFGGSGYSALAAGLVLACMIVPAHVSLSLDALRAVPRDIRQASDALGSTPWETACCAVWPAARRGLLAAATVALARAIGETMAVLMVAGNAPQLPASVLAPVRTLTAAIAAEMGEAVPGSAHYHVLFVAGGVLFVASVMLQATVRRLLRAGTGAA